MSDSTLVHFLVANSTSSVSANQIKVYKLETTKSDVAQLLSLFTGVFWLLRKEKTKGSDEFLMK